MPVLIGKHMEAIYKGKYIPAYISTNKYKDAGKILGDEVKKFMAGEQDVNTTLRVAEEGIQKHIQQVDTGSGK
jgi:multiple sugar transport system substrate-binding protein